MPNGSTDLETSNLQSKASPTAIVLTEYACDTRMRKYLNYSLCSISKSSLRSAHPKTQKWKVSRHTSKDVARSVLVFHSGSLYDAQVGDTWLSHVLRPECPWCQVLSIHSAPSMNGAQLPESYYPRSCSISQAQSIFYAPLPDPIVL